MHVIEYNFIRWPPNGGCFAREVQRSGATRWPWCHPGPAISISALLTILLAQTPMIERIVAHVGHDRFDTADSIMFYLKGVHDRDGPEAACDAARLMIDVATAFIAHEDWANRRRQRVLRIAGKLAGASGVVGRTTSARKQLYFFFRNIWINFLGNSRKPLSARPAEA